MTSETDVQNWINENWDWSKGDYENCEALLAKLQRWEEQERGKGSEAYELIGKLFERVQFMRELALSAQKGRVQA